MNISIRTALFVLSFAVVLSVTASDLPGGALIINGAPPGLGNYDDNFWDIDHAKALFSGWKQSLLSSSGSGNRNELNAMSENLDFSFKYDEHGMPILHHYEEPNAEPADLAHFTASFNAMTSGLPAGAPMVVYFAGHGGPGETVLADRHNLTVDGLKQILRTKSPDRRTIFAFDTCNGASMFPALLNSPNTCGFAAASPDEYSYSGQMMMDEVGQMHSSFSFADVVGQMRRKDDKISLEMSTSDYFLEQYYDKDPHSDGLKDLNSLCLFNSNSATSVLGKQGPLFDTMSVAVLHGQIAQIRISAQEAVLHSEVQVRAASLESTMADYQQAYELANSAEDQLATVRSHLISSYVKVKVGEKTWQKYSDLYKQIDELQKQREQAATFTEHTDSSIESLRRELQEIQSQIHKITDGISYSESSSQMATEFAAFMDAQEPDFACPANVVKADPQAGQRFSNCKKAASRLIRKLAAARRPTARAVLAIKEANALDSMAKNHDFGAIQKYLELIRCEKTVLNKTNPGKGGKL